MEYQWESVQEEDFNFGVSIMFLSAVLGFFLIFFMTICRDDHGFALDGGQTPKRRRSGSSVPYRGTSKR